MHVMVISTGGTIACTAGSDGALVPTLSAAELVAQSATVHEVRAVDANRIDSSSATLADLDRLREAVRTSLLDASVAGVVVTHGTDSLAETALGLDLVHRDPRPVILTGAMRPADDAAPDGPANLRGAIEAAARPQRAGVHIHFDSATLPARGAMKVATTAHDAFALASPRPLPRPMPVPAAPLAGLDVPIVRAWAGADGRLVEAVRDADGVILEALGSGNVSSEMGESVAALLRRGTPVVVASSVPHGDVSFSYGGAGGGSTLGALGAIPAGYLSAGQARVALATALATGVDPRSLL